MFFAGKVWRIYGKGAGFDKNLAKEMLRYAIPMMPNSLSWWISNSSDKYIVTWFCGTAVTGIYSVAYKMPSMISVVVQIFYNAWSISAVDGFGSEETLKFYNSIYKKYIAGTFFFAS